MREKRLTFAVWQEGRPYEWWEGRPPPDPKTVDDVQLTVVYETLEKYEREAVNTAWQVTATDRCLRTLQHFWGGAD